MSYKLQTAEELLAHAKFLSETYPMSFGNWFDNLHPQEQQIIIHADDAVLAAAKAERAAPLLAERAEVEQQQAAEVEERLQPFKEEFVAQFRMANPGYATREVENAWTSFGRDAALRQLQEQVAQQDLASFRRLHGGGKLF